MEIKNGSIYKHFKGGLYQVICVASHSETDEKLVIYQALYGKYEIYARPLKEFIGQVDRNKYPDSPQLYRFCEISRESLPVKDDTVPKAAGSYDSSCEYQPASSETKPDVPVIMQFLDADTSEEKLAILKANISKIDEKTINNIEASMDIVSDSTVLDTRINYICDVLRTRSKYESNRLR